MGWAHRQAFAFRLSNSLEKVLHNLSEVDESVGGGVNVVPTYSGELRSGEGSNNMVACETIWSLNVLCRCGRGEAAGDATGDPARRELSLN